MQEYQMCLVNSLLCHEYVVLEKTIFPRSMVQHPNIFGILGSVIKESKIAIISNLVKGCNLEQLIFNGSTKVHRFILYIRLSCGWRVPIYISL